MIPLRFQRDNDSPDFEEPVNSNDAAKAWIRNSAVPSSTLSEYFLATISPYVSGWMAWIAKATHQQCLGRGLQSWTRRP